MKGHRYRVTLEHVELAREGQALQPEPMVFDTVNHDELFAIVEKIRARVALSDDETKSFAIGLKLLGEVILRHRSAPPFSELWPTMLDLITRIKSMPLQTVDSD